MLLDFFVERAFDVEVFDDGFDDQIAILDLIEVIIEVSYADERGVVRRKERSRLGLLRRFEAASRDALAYLLALNREPLCLLLRRDLSRDDIEQQRGHTCISEVRGNLRPHRPRPQHRRPLNPHARTPPLRHYAI